MEIRRKEKSYLILLLYFQMRKKFTKVRYTTIRKTNDEYMYSDRYSHFIPIPTLIYFAQEQFWNLLAQSKNSYFPRQSENSYFVQGNSGIVPILTLRRTYTSHLENIFELKLLLCGFLTLPGTRGT